MRGPMTYIKLELPCPNDGEVVLVALKTTPHGLLKAHTACSKEYWETVSAAKIGGMLIDELRTAMKLHERDAK